MTKTLVKEHGRLTVEKTGPAYAMDTALSNGYRQVAPNVGIFISETYFDLAGMTIDDKTLFFEGAAVQEASSVIVDNAVAGDAVSIVDLMTTSPVSDQDLIDYPLFANMLESSLTFDQVIYGRTRYQNMDLDNLAGGLMITIMDNQTGSLEPTSSDRIYCYRVVSFQPGNSDGTYFAWGARYLIRATAKEEPEYEYLMRLKRSYELQNEPDRD